MSYIRYGHDLCWFNDKSDLYVFHNGDYIEDYDGSMHMPSVIEHIGHMIYRETHDFEYATLMVLQLADKCGCYDKIRTEFVVIHPDSIYEQIEIQINQYVVTIKKMIPIYESRVEKCLNG